MDIARLGPWVCVLLMPAVISCAGVPVEQLQAYSDAYEEAREAGSLLYERAAIAVWTAEATGVEPGAAPPNSPPYPAVAVRSELGQLAVALDGLQRFLDQNTTVTTLLAGAGPLVGPFLVIVGEAQKLASGAA